VCSRLPPILACSSPLFSGYEYRFSQYSLQRFSIFRSSANVRSLLSLTIFTVGQPAATCFVHLFTVNPQRLPNFSFYRLVHYGPHNYSPKRLARRRMASSCNASQLPPFLKHICHPGNCLHDRFLPKHDPSVSHRLRHSTVYPHPSGPNKTVLLLYKLLPKVLPVTIFVIAPFYAILCVYVVHITFLCNSHKLYMYLCFILVVLYIVFLYCVSL